MNNKHKAMIAHGCVLFILGGFAKVIQKAADNKIEEKWPELEKSD